MTMADAEFTTNPTDAGSQRVPDAEFLHASERANADAQSDEDVGTWCLSLLEDALEVERARLMRANSMLGCVQIALDPEAVEVRPVVYFPEVLEMIRRLIDTSVRRLEYEEIRRLFCRSVD
jgi:hypothetical protein